MSCWSARAQTEPLAALVAVAAVAVGLSLYAGALDGALEGSPAPEIAEPTLDRVERVVAPAGVVRPAALAGGRAHAPAGHDVNLTLTTATGDRWTAGPTPPAHGTDGAERSVSVRAGPTDVRPARLRAVVW